MFPPRQHYMDLWLPSRGLIISDFLLLLRVKDYGKGISRYDNLVMLLQGPKGRWKVPEGGVFVETITDV